MKIRDFKIRKTQQTYNLIGKIKVKVLIILATIVALILTTQLVFATNLATDGEKLSQIEQEIRLLEQKNTTLKIEIASLSALKTLSQRAEDLNFKKPSEIIAP